MVCATGVAVLAVVAAACFGGSGTAGPTRPARADTRVVIRTSIGPPARRPAAIAARCPALARCRTRRVRGVRPREWALVAVRTLTCDPDRGGYRRPAAACRALRDLVRLEAHPTNVTCGCIVQAAPRSSIVGRVDGRPISLTLGACAFCGLPAHAGADGRVLLG
jgi:hypothetical protein